MLLVARLAGRIVPDAARHRRRCQWIAVLRERATQRPRAYGASLEGSGRVRVCTASPRGDRLRRGALPSGDRVTARLHRHVRWVLERFFHAASG